MPAPLHPKRPLSLLLSCGFAVVMTLVASVVAPRTARVDHDRASTLFVPPWHRAFPRAFEAYLRDHLGFRRQWISLSSAIDYFAFRTAPPNTVLVGKQGFLFLNQDFMPEALENRPFSKAQLTERVGFFEEIQRALDEFGGKLLVVIAPNKASIFPQHLPDGYRPSSWTRLDHLYEALAEVGIATLDLRPTLRSSKELVYDRLDTHWNGRGTALATAEIDAAISRMTGWASRFDASKVRFQDEKSAGDLARLAGLEDWLTETHPQAIWTGSKAQSLGTNPYLNVAKGARLRGLEVRYALPALANDVKTGLVLVQHDSFGFPNTLQAVLPHVLPKSHWVLETHDIDLARLAELKPRVMIYLAAERYLFGAIPGKSSTKPLTMPKRTRIEGESLWPRGPR